MISTRIVLTCDDCKTTVDSLQNDVGVAMPNGWRMDSVSLRHLCPECTAKRKEQE